MSSQYTRMKAVLDNYRNNPARRPEVIIELENRLRFANTIQDDKWARDAADKVLKGEE